MAAGRSSGADDARRQQGRRWVRALTDLRFGPRQARVAPGWAADGCEGPAADGGDRPGALWTRKRAQGAALAEREAAVALRDP